MYTKLSVRYKLLLLLGGTIFIFALSMAGLFASQLAGLHEDESQARITAALNLFSHDLNQTQDRLMQNALALAGQDDVIASVSMISTYQNPDNYQPLIFDVEKKTLADLLFREAAIAGSSQTTLYDAKGQLVAFCRMQEKNGCLSGYLTFHDRTPAIEIFDETGKPLPSISIAPTVATSFSLPFPDAPQQTITASPQGLILEAIAPLLRDFPDGSDKVVGFISVRAVMDIEFLRSVSERSHVEGALFHDAFGSLHYDPQDTPIERPSVSAEAPTAFENHPNDIEWSQSDGHYIGASLIPLTGGGFVTIAMVTHDSETIASLTAFRNAILLGFSLTMLLILPAAVLFARRMFILPIENLEWKTRLVAEGRYDELKGFVGQDEFGMLAQSINAMADNVRERERQLRETIDALTKAKAEIERFTQLAAHDLKEPSRQIVMYAQMLERNIREQDIKNTQSSLDFVVGGARRMRMMVDDLDQYTNLHSDTPPFGPVDCQLACQQAIVGLKSNIERANANVVFESLPQVLGDAAQIILLFRHLIENAVKFRKPDVAPQIVLSARREGTEWLFTVQDNGIGIEKQYWEKIFGIFTRLWTHERYPGTGLGLALCKRIVEQHGGRIWVESSPESGSTFRFTLPATDAPLTPPLV